MRNTYQRPKIIFFGTDPFADIVLKALQKADFDVIMAITKPVVSKDLDLPPADLGVVAVYGKILSKKILEHFPHGVLNIHPSLLPKYRGPSPIRTAIANGDTQTGVTVIKLDDQMDHGPVLANKELRIMNYEKHDQIRDRLAHAGAELLIKTIPLYLDGTITSRPQDETHATYTKMLTRDDGMVDLATDSPEIIYNKFRAYETWPGIWTMHKGKRVKIINCHFDHDRVYIDNLQPEGKKPMSMLDYINGYGPLNIT